MLDDESARAEAAIIEWTSSTLQLLGFVEQGRGVGGNVDGVFAKDL